MFAWMGVLSRRVVPAIVCAWREGQKGLCSNISYLIFIDRLQSSSAGKNWALVNKRELLNSNCWHRLVQWPHLDSPASKWMHWATLWRHSDLFWAATSASFQVIPILDKSLLTVLLQFARGRPGPPLNPWTSQCNACRGIRWWSIRSLSHVQYPTIIIAFV